MDTVMCFCLQRVSPRTQKHKEPGNHNLFILWNTQTHEHGLGHRLYNNVKNIRWLRLPTISIRTFGNVYINVVVQWLIQWTTTNGRQSDGLQAVTEISSSLQQFNTETWTWTTCQNFHPTERLVPISPVCSHPDGLGDVLVHSRREPEILSTP